MQRGGGIKRGASGMPLGMGAKPRGGGAGAVAAMGGYGAAAAGWAYGAGYGGYDDGYSMGYGGYGMDGFPLAPMGTGANSHTSSKDPKAVKSRIFVGNLNTKVVTREQLERLFSRFGVISAVSVHKGYAFVQFNSEAIARNAVSFTDGMTIAGQVLDVNVSDEPKAGGNSGSNDGSFSGGPSAKRSRGEPLMGDESNGNQLQLYEYPEHPDLLKCGHCKQSFPTLTAFKEHRKFPCTLVKAEPNDAKSGGTGKQPGEPETLYCFICKSPYKLSWHLIQHLNEKHNMMVYAAEG